MQCLDAPTVCMESTKCITDASHYVCMESTKCIPKCITGCMHGEHAQALLESALLGMQVPHVPQPRLLSAPEISWPLPEGFVPMNRERYVSRACV